MQGRGRSQNGDFRPLIEALQGREVIHPGQVTLIAFDVLKL
jgi:hypothetical protein